VGIEYQDMKSILAALKHAAPAARRNLLFLGDAQIHFDAGSYVDLAEDVGFELASVPRTLDLGTLGNSLGYARVESLDINGKASLNLDLQQEIPAALSGQFDCLIDAGVLFWCYDPAAALRNILRLVRDGGLIVHITAVSGHYGRGYYNIHPSLFEDFYRINQCDFVHASYRTKPARRNWVGRIKSLFRNTRDAELVSYSRHPGNVYLKKATATNISFGDRLALPESDLIPNNVVGTFAFRKNASAEPRGPIRL